MHRIFRTALFLLAFALVIAVPVTRAQGRLDSDSAEGARNDQSDDPADAGRTNPREPDSILVQVRENHPESTVETQLDEITVTATKSKRALREIPATIAVVDGTNLEASGAQGLDDYLKLVPGVTLKTQDYGPSKITIRGIAPDDLVSGTTGILFGNVSFNDFWRPSVPLDPNPFDLQDVEVLKGPVGTLFGASALNGAIRFVPEPPEFGVAAVKYFAQYTSVKDGRAAPVFGAALNTPVGKEDNAALRLVGFNRTSPGYVDNLQLDIADANELRQDGMRAMAAWAPGQRLNLSAMYVRQKTETLSVSSTDNPDGRLSTDNQPSLSPTHSVYDLADLGAEYVLDWATVFSESAFVRKRTHLFLDTSRVVSGDHQILAIDQASASDTWSQELRMASPEDGDHSWRWVLGVFWTRQAIFNDVDLPVGRPNGSLEDANAIYTSLGLVPPAEGFVTSTGQPSAAKATGDVAMTEHSLFCDITRRLGKTWEVAMGARLYRTTSGGTATNAGPLYAYAVPPGSTRAVTTGEIRERGLSPKFSLSWFPTKFLVSYVTASKGFRVGGIQGGTTAPDSSTKPPEVYKSDYIVNLETGLRSRWFDGALQIDVSAFREKWSNPQLLQTDPAQASQWIDNVGGAKSVGAETSLLYRSQFGLMLSTSAALVRAVTTAPFATGTGVQAASGSTWPLAPRWQTSTTLSYIVGTEAGLMLAPSLTHTYTSEAWTNLDHVARVYGYHSVDMQITLSDESFRWLPTLSLIASNVTNIHAVVDRNVFTTYVDTTYIRPRAFTLRMAGTF